MKERPIIFAGDAVRAILAGRHRSDNLILSVHALRRITTQRRPNNSVASGRGKATVRQRDDCKRDCCRVPHKCAAGKASAQGRRSLDETLRAASRYRCWCSESILERRSAGAPRRLCDAVDAKRGSARASRRDGASHRQTVTALGGSAPQGRQSIQQQHHQPGSLCIPDGTCRSSRSRKPHSPIGQRP